jgi:hypothetical protein
MHGAQPSSVHGLEISTAAREHPITILLRQRAWLPVYDRRLGPLIRPRSRSVLHAGKARTGLRLAGFPGVVLPRSQGQPCRCTCRCACSLIESWRMPRWRIRSFSTISRPLVCRLSNWSRRRPAGPGTPSVARSIRNGVEAACFSAPRRVPSLGWVLFRESEPGQHAQRGVGFRERKARLHAILAGSRCHGERDRASLRLMRTRFRASGMLRPLRLIRRATVCATGSCRAAVMRPLSTVCPGRHKGCQRASPKPRPGRDASSWTP